MLAAGNEDNWRKQAFTYIIPSAPVLGQRAGDNECEADLSPIIPKSQFPDLPRLGNWLGLIRNRECNSDSSPTRIAKRGCQKARLTIAEGLPNIRPNFGKHRDLRAIA